MKVIGSVLLLSVCLLPHASLAETGYAKMSVEALCMTWRFEQDGAALVELEKRAGFSAREWRAIKQQKLFVGMSELAATCSRGVPESGSVNLFSLLGAAGGGPATTRGTGNVWSKDGKWGRRTVYRYFYLDLHIYVENGVVVNFAQDPDFRVVEIGFFDNVKEIAFERLPPPPEHAWYVYRD